MGDDTYALIGTELKTAPGFYFGDFSYWVRVNDAADSGIVMFQAPEACDLTGMTAYCKGVAGTAPFLKYQLEGIDSSGNPDGTVLAETAAFQPTAAQAEAHAYTSAYTCTQSQPLCGRLLYASGTVDGSNYADMTYATSNTRYNLMPYAGYWTGSSWYKNYDNYPAFAIQTTLTDIDFGGIYNIGATSTHEAITTSGDRFAQRIEIPASENIELHVDGFRFWGGVENSGGADVIIGVWPESGSPLVETTIDSGQQLQQMSSTTPMTREYIFHQDVTLQSGTVYYMGFEHAGGGASDNLNVSYLQPGGANGLKSWPGGASFYASKYSSSTWTDDNTKRLLLNPMLSSLHGTASGGAGSTTRPTMGVIG